MGLFLLVIIRFLPQGLGSIGRRRHLRRQDSVPPRVPARALAEPEDGKDR